MLIGNYDPVTTYVNIVTAVVIEITFARLDDPILVAYLAM